MNLKIMLIAALIASALCGCASSHWNKPAPEISSASTIYSISPLQTQQQEITAEIKNPKDAQIDNSEKSTEIKTAKPKETQAKTEQIKEPKPQAEITNQENNFIFTSDGRLMHPWYGAQEAKTYAGEKPNWFGESLKFKIGWSFITAGEANLTANKIVTADGLTAFAVEAYAQSYSAIDKLFKVRDINISWISADLKKSLGYWQSVREGRYKRDEWLIFDYKNNFYTIYKQNNKKELSKELIEFNGNSVWDMLSSLYFVRSQELPLNGTIYFDIVNVKKQYPLKVTVHGKETIKTKAGKFDCIIVEPAISGEGIFVSKGKSLKVWLTDDKYRMPVKMSVEVFIGSVYAELISYERGDK